MSSPRLWTVAVYLVFLLLRLVYGMLDCNHSGTSNSNLVKDVIMNLSEEEFGRAIDSKRVKTYEAGGKIPYDRPNNGSKAPKWKMIIPSFCALFFQEAINFILI